MEKTWRWMLGMLLVVAVALIWIVASFVVQSVVGAGVSPFLLTYICNSLFVIYLPIVEAANFVRSKWLHKSENQDPANSKEDADNLLEDSNSNSNPNDDDSNNREWSRREIAHVSLLICPFWFLAQFTFNLSLKYTSVTVSIGNEHLSMCGQL